MEFPDPPSDEKCISLEQFYKLMKPAEPEEKDKKILDDGTEVSLNDGAVLVMGEKFTLYEIGQAKDFMHILNDYGILNLPLDGLSEFVKSSAVMDEENKNVGARLVLALILKPETAGAFLMKEDDKRLIGICQRRIRNQDHGLDIDSPIIIP